MPCPADSRYSEKEDTLKQYPMLVVLKKSYLAVRVKPSWLKSSIHYMFWVEVIVKIQELPPPSSIAGHSS